jgi:hypothetical protein
MLIDFESPAAVLHSRSKSLVVRPLAMFVTTTQLRLHFTRPVFPLAHKQVVALLADYLFLSIPEYFLGSSIPALDFLVACHGEHAVGSTVVLANIFFRVASHCELVPVYQVSSM